MAFAGFKTMGPECGCCCSDLYSSPADAFRTRVNFAAGTDELIAQSRFVPSGFDSSCSNTRLSYDATNKRLYMIVVDANVNHKAAIASVDENLGDGQVVIETDWDISSERYGEQLAVHPGDEYIFYGAYDFPTGGSYYLRRINYDGSGGTTLLSGGSSGTAMVNGIGVTPDSAYVFYLLRKTSGTDELRRCAFDGSGDTQIWNSSDNNNVPTRVVIDADNERVIWARGGSDPKLLSEAWGGGDLLTLSDDLGSYIAGGWISAMQKVLFYSLNDGLYTIDADGANQTQIIDDADWDGSPGPNQLVLGCGLA